MDTPIDMAKVTQLLDAGWTASVRRSDMGSYDARATHPNPAHVSVVKGILMSRLPDGETYRDLYEDMSPYEVVEEYDMDGDAIITDDFTPGQALTRLAYKVLGEII